MKGTIQAAVLTLVLWSTASAATSRLADPIVVQDNQGRGFTLAERQEAMSGAVKWQQDATQSLADQSASIESRFAIAVRGFALRVPGRNMCDELFDSMRSDDLGALKTYAATFRSKNLVELRAAKAILDRPSQSPDTEEMAVRRVHLAILLTEDWRTACALAESLSQSVHSQDGQPSVRLANLAHITEVPSSKAQFEDISAILHESYDLWIRNPQRFIGPQVMKSFENIGVQGLEQRLHDGDEVTLELISFCGWQLARTDVLEQVYALAKTNHDMSDEMKNTVFRYYSYDAFSRRDYTRAIAALKLGMTTPNATIESRCETVLRLGQVYEASDRYEDAGLLYLQGEEDFAGQAELKEAMTNSFSRLLQFRLIDRSLAAPKVQSQKPDQAMASSTGGTNHE